MLGMGPAGGKVGWVGLANTPGFELALIILCLVKTLSKRGSSSAASFLCSTASYCTLYSASSSFVVVEIGGSWASTPIISSYALSYSVISLTVRLIDDAMVSFELSFGWLCDPEDALSTFLGGSGTTLIGSPALLLRPTKGSRLSCKTLSAWLEKLLLGRTMLWWFLQ